MSTTGKHINHEIFHRQAPHIAETWDLEKQPAVGYLDPRHVTLNMASPEDTKRALSRPSNKINNSLFRLFRWSPEFEIGKESSFAPVWVKLFKLPLHYYNEAALQRLGSIVGTVLRVDTNTLDLVHQVYARVCIEIDVSQPLQDKLWIGTKEHGWLIDVEYEGNHAFCSYCGLLGHTQGLCRKKRQALGKATVDTNPKDTPFPEPLAKAGLGKWVAKQKGEIQPTMPREILKKPEGGIDEDTRKVLQQAGLLSDTDEGSSAENNGAILNNEQGQVQDSQTRPNFLPTTKEGIQDEDNTSLKLSNQEGELVKPPMNTDNRKNNKTANERTGGGVITTPTKNRFDVLDTEVELQSAYRNLQRSESKNKLALITIPEEQEQYFSDGSGTRSKSIMGVPENLSDGEGEELKNAKSHQTAPRKQHTPYSSEQNDNPQPSF